MSSKLIVFQVTMSLDKSMVNRGFSYDDEIRNNWFLSRLYLYNKYKKANLSSDEIMSKCIDELSRCKPYNVDYDNKLDRSILVADIVYLLYRSDNLALIDECAKGVEEVLGIKVSNPRVLREAVIEDNPFSDISEEDFNKIWNAVEPLITLETSVIKYHRLEDEISLSLMESLASDKLATEYTLGEHKVVLGLLSTMLNQGIDWSIPVLVHYFYIKLDSGISLGATALCSIVSKYISERLKSSVSFLNVRQTIVRVIRYFGSGEKHYFIKYNDKKCMFESKDSPNILRSATPQVLRYPETISAFPKGLVGTGSPLMGVAIESERVLGLKALEEEHGITFYRNGVTGEIYPIHTSDFTEDGIFKEEYLDLSKLNKVEHPWEFSFNIQRL